MGIVDSKVVIVTGAGQGIGREIALQLAQNGASVVVNDVGFSKSGASIAESVVSEIRAKGGEATPSTDSVADGSSATRIVQAAMDVFGRVDGLVNNAGIVRDRFFFNMSEEEWNSVIQTNLSGPFHVARAAAPHFKAQNGGAYVHMTSIAGLSGNIGQANYSAAKIGLVGLSKSIAIDMAKFAVRSNCVAPWAWTPMTATIPDTPENAARIARLKRMEASKVAPLVIYLLSDHAGKVSGQIFGVRANEIYLFSQMGIVRSLHNSDGWTAELIAGQVMPAMESQLSANLLAPQATPWDPM